MAFHMKEKSFSCWSPVILTRFFQAITIASVLTWSSSRSMAQAKSPTRDSIPRVWFGGIDPVVADDRRRIGSDTTPDNDFMSLFRPDAPWGHAAADIQVFKVSTQFLQRSTDAQLVTVIRDLKRRHMALGMAAEIMIASRACGNGVPGYSTHQVIQSVADRVARLGGSIDYVAFDSAVAFGHFARERPTACHYSIHDLAENMAPNIKTLKDAFPTVKFGDAEPVNNHTVGWLDQYLDFANQFKEVTGEPLSFMQADLIWYDRWQPQLIDWRTRLHQAGISYGVIIDGSSIDRNDVEWTHHAIERYQMVTGSAKMKPDSVLIGTWYKYPSEFLPEGRDGTLTSVILQTVGKSSDVGPH